MVGERVEEFAGAGARDGAGRSRPRVDVMPGWWYAISARVFSDRLTETPDTLALAPGVKCPSLFVRGDKEPREQYPPRISEREPGGPCTVEIVPELRPLLQRASGEGDPGDRIVVADWKRCNQQSHRELLLKFVTTSRNCAPEI